MAFSNHSEVCVPSLELGEQKNAAGSSHSNNGEAPRLNGRPQIFGSTMQEILFVFTATMSVAMPSFLQGSTLVVTSQIQKDLGMTTSQLTWMTASSSGILLAGLVSFVVLALAAGFSKNGLVLDVLNGVMGLSSAATIPSAQGILGSIYERPSKRKNVVFAWITAGNHLGFVLSSIFSGVAAQLFGWSASFWLLAIIYTAVASIAYFVVPCEEEQKLKSALELVKRLDFLGAALIVCGIGLLTVGIR
ncbi:hypothetical protein MMC10_005720 [Thelotrema lepadinum]|nr:hypothetical protein [Thelotrema lepadinum]